MEPNGTSWKNLVFDRFYIWGHVTSIEKWHFFCIGVLWCEWSQWFSWSGFNWQWLVYQATNHNLITLSWLEASSNLITGREQRRTLKIDPLQHLNGSSDKSFLSNLSIRSLAFLVNFLAVAKCICVIKALKWTLIYWTLFGQSVDHITWLLIRWQLY